jgi:ubiquinone/menaquinone biosynthesis C-methylase UbiE
VLDDHLARYSFVAPFIKGKIVADVGCGEGYGSDMIRKGGASEVIGLDNDPLIVRAAQAKYPGMRFVAASATETGLPDASVDVAVSFEVWHHLDQYEDFIPEMYRILKPNGMLICSIPNRHVIYLNPFHRKMLTKFYRKDFDKKIIEHYLTDHFDLKEWWGQRFVRPGFTNPLLRFFFWLLTSVSRRFADRINHAYKLANGPAVLPLPGQNSRILIFVAKRTGKLANTTF